MQWGASGWKACSKGFATSGATSRWNFEPKVCRSKISSCLGKFYVPHWWYSIQHKKLTRCIYTVPQGEFISHIQSCYVQRILKVDTCLLIINHFAGCWIKVFNQGLFQVAGVTWATSKHWFGSNRWMGNHSNSWATWAKGVKGKPDDSFCFSSHAKSFFLLSQLLSQWYILFQSMELPLALPIVRMLSGSRNIDNCHRVSLLYQNPISHLLTVWIYSCPY